MQNSCFVKFESNDKELKTQYLCQQIYATDPVYLDLQDNDIEIFIKAILKRYVGYNPVVLTYSHKFIMETELMTFYDCIVEEIKDNIAKIQFDRVGFK